MSSFSHINSLSVFSLFAAKSAKIPIRIAHSHSTTNKKEWNRRCLHSIANMGYFSSDRSIRDYAKNIWGLE